MRRRYQRISLSDRSLHDERDTGIRVQCKCTGPVLCKWKLLVEQQILGGFPERGTAQIDAGLRKRTVSGIRESGIQILASMHRLVIAVDRMVHHGDPPFTQKAEA